MAPKGERDEVTGELPHRQHGTVSIPGSLVIARPAPGAAASAARSFDSTGARFLFNS